MIVNFYVLPTTGWVLFSNYVHFTVLDFYIVTSLLDLLYNFILVVDKEFIYI